jgi:hypothetical protein
MRGCAGVHFGEEEPLMRRIADFAEDAAWHADHLARCTRREPLIASARRCPSRSGRDRARSDRDQNDDLFAIVDFERELREDDSDRTIDLILKILRMESIPVLLSLLTAGPLEDVISLRTIDRIEREARAAGTSTTCSAASGITGRPMN